MYKHSLSRNQRSKGFKAKQILQICVLVAVCFWLVYQVKHSHDKKKAFEESDASNSLETFSHHVKFDGGRKDIQDRLEEKPSTTKRKDEEVEEENGVEEDDSKHEENVEEDDNKYEENEDEDDSKHEENGEEDDSKNEENGEEGDNKHEVEEEEQEREDNNKNEEKEDDRRGGGDDEIDEHEQEKSEMEIEHEVDVLDEERNREDVNEKEENENEDKDTQNEGGDHVEEHEHGAREEQYKGDDASSAVTHISESVSAETERGTLENPVEKMETKGLEDGNVAFNGTGLSKEKGDIKNVMAKEEGEYKIVLSIQDKNPISNSSTTTEANTREEMGNDLGKKSTKSNDTTMMNSTETKTKQEAGGEKINTNRSVNDAQSNYTRNMETFQGESSNSSTIWETDVSAKQKTAGTEENQNENLELEKETGESETGEGDLGHHDPIDNSDSSITLEKDVRTDLDTLPDIRTEGSNDEEAAAE